MAEPEKASLFRAAPPVGIEPVGNPGAPAVGLGGESGARPAGAGGELTGVVDGIGATVGGVTAVGGAGTGDAVGAVVGDCAMADPTKRAKNTRPATVAEPIFSFPFESVIQKKKKNRESVLLCEEVRRR